MNRMRGIDKDTRMDLEGLPRHVELTTVAPTYQMKVSDSVISFVSSAADGAGIATLPSVAEAVGQSYYIVAPTGLAGGNISLYEKETGSALPTNGVMGADGDHLLLYATGVSWLAVVDGVV
jgi:uncharacterized membrane protein